MIETSGACARVVLVAGRDVLPAGLQSALFRKRIMVFREAAGAGLDLRVMGHAPDIALLWQEPNGPLPLGPLHELREHLPVLLVTRSGSIGRALDGLRAGASGYLLLESLGEELGLVVNCARREQRFISPKVCGALLDLFVGMAQRPDEELTRRQRQILQRLAQGKTVKEVAHAMQLSVKTVNAHRLNIKRKLSIGNLADLIFYALRNGLVDFPATREAPPERGRFVPTPVPVPGAVHASEHVSPREPAC